MTGAGLARRSWLRHEPPDDADDADVAAAVRLVCLPHAGAGASSFARWVALFPPAVAVVRVQLPGREDVAAEPPLRRVGDAVDALLPQVARPAGTPVALYGHSMGALVAFELARALGAAGTPPVHLFVSGRRAPQRSSRRRPVHRLPDDELVAALASMGGPVPGGGSSALRRYAVRLVRADLELSEEYAYRAGPRLPCPITAFAGAQDPIVDGDEVEAWAEQTGAAFALHSFAGGHFFHQHHRAAVTARIATALR